MPSATAAPKVEVYNTPSPYSYSSIGPGPGAHISAPTPAPTPAEVLTAKRDAAVVAWLNGINKTPPSASYMNYTEQAAEQEEEEEDDLDDQSQQRRCHPFEDRVHS